MPASELRLLIAIVREAEALVEKELIRALARGTAPSTAAERDSRLRLIRAILGRLRLDVAGPARDLIRTAYDEGSESALAGVRRAGKTPVSTRLEGIHVRAVQTLLDALTDALDDAVAYVGRRSKDVFRKATLNQLVVEQITGHDRSQTAKAIEDDLRGRGIKGFKDKAGREWKLSTYAKMAARSSAVEAHTVSTLNRLAENGIDLVKVSEHPHPHDVCSRYEGRIFSISGTSAKYPALKEAPPFHPNCKHLLLPYIERLQVSRSN